MFPDEQYRLKPPTPGQLLQQPLRVFLFLTIVLFYIGIILPYIHNYKVSGDFWKTTVLPILASYVVYLFYLTGRKIKKHAELVLTINDEFITLQNGKQEQKRLASSQIKSITKGYKGAFYIISGQPAIFMLIPGGMEDGEKIEKRLLEIMPITDNEATETQNMKRGRAIAFLLISMALALPVFKRINLQTISILLFSGAIISLIIRYYLAGGFKGDWKARLRGFYNLIPRRTRNIILIVLIMILLNLIIVNYFHMQQK